MKQYRNENHIAMMLERLGVTLNPWQRAILLPEEFGFDNVKYLHAVTGNQSGKSFLLSLKIAMVLSVPGTYVAILIPVLKMARKQLFPYLANQFRNNGAFGFMQPKVTDTFHEMSIKCNHHGHGESKVEVLSLFNEDYLEDIVADLIVTDELASCSPQNMRWLDNNMHTRIMTKRGQYCAFTTSKGNKPWVREYNDKIRRMAKEGVTRNLGIQGKVHYGNRILFIDKISPYDNIEIPDVEEFHDDVREVEKRLGEKIAAERIWGEEISYEGLVWSSFDKSIHMVEEKLTSEWRLVWCVDLGFQDETVFFLGGIKDEGGVDRIHIFDGFKVTRKTPVKLAPMMDEVLKRHGINKTEIQGYSDHNSQVYECFNEPTEPYRFSCKAAIKPDLHESVMYMDVLWALDRLTISPKVEFLSDDIYRYEYDKEKIRHEFSHSPDACRMLVCSLLYDKIEKIDFDEIKIPEINAKPFSFGGMASNIQFNWRQ